MKSFRKWGLYTTVLMGLLLCACSPASNEVATTTSGPDKEQVTASDQAAKASEGYSEVVAIIDNATWQPKDFKLSDMGNVSFTEEAKSNKKLMSVSSGGTLGLVDKAGNQWTLKVPPFALRTATEVEMVALNNVASDSMAVPFSGGIKLLPEGLSFVIPVTLKLEAANGLKEILPLMGAGSGANMSFIHFDEATQEMRFDHFSSLVFTDKGSLRTATSFGEIEKKVLKKAEEDNLLVQKYLAENKNTLEVPSPVAVSLACESADGAKKSGEQSAKFVENAFEPEGLMIRMLLSDLQGITFLSAEAPIKSSLEQNLGLLYRRLGLKAIKLMDTYSGKPDYLVSVLQFAIKVTREMEAANFTGESLPIVGALMERMTLFITSSLTPILERLTEEHDYTQAQVALKVASWAASVGDFDTSDIMEKVRAAMKFNLELSVKYVTVDTSYGVDATMPIDFEYFSPQTGNNLRGKGTSVLNYATSVPDVSMSAGPEPISVLITEFDPCSGMGYFIMDSLYVSNEVMTIDGESRPIPLTKRWWEFAFEAYAFSGGSAFEYMNGDKLYKFPFTINNFNAVTFSESVEGQNNAKGKMTITFEYKLTH